MVEDVRPDDIARYRSSARRAGREPSHLSDSQIAEQLRILKGALRAPSKSRLEDIRARAKRTESLFRKLNGGALKSMKKASLQFGKADSGRGERPGQSSARAGKVAKQILLLQHSLLKYPPSMLSPEIRNIVTSVDQWAAIAKRWLEGGRRRDAVLISTVPGELSSLLDVLRKRKRE